MASGGARESLIEWGFATLPLPGQTQSGDLHFVRVWPDGALLAAVDGLGHGREAATAARLAVAILEAHETEPLEALMRLCHEALRGTRGAVLSAARIDAAAGALAWLGVGNVEGFLSRARPAASRRGRDQERRLIPDAGVLGSRLPPLHPRAVPLEPGDLLILATDGVDAGFADDPLPSGSPREIAKRLLAAHGRSTDDALVLVVRYLGPAGDAPPA